MKYLVLYTSKTGNTEKLARTIYQALPGDSKEIKPMEEYEGTEEAGIIFLGFWVDRGSCPLKVADVLEQLEGRRLALFGTCGMGDSQEYFASVRRSLAAWMPDECECLGFFLCQGKMQPSVLEKYKNMQGQIPKEQLDSMIANYEKGLTHPDSQDLENAEAFVREVLERE